MARTISKITIGQEASSSVMRSYPSDELISVDKSDLAKLIKFFKLLQQWEREAKDDAEVM